jgi:hypothetical protein
MIDQPGSGEKAQCVAHGAARNAEAYRERRFIQACAGRKLALDDLLGQPIGNVLGERSGLSDDRTSLRMQSVILVYDRPWS